MAIVFDAATAYDNSGNPGTLHTWSHTTSTPSTVIVWGGHTGGQSISAITYDSIALTLINNGTGGRGHMHYLLAPSSGSNVASITLGGSDNYGAGVITLEGTATDLNVVGANDTEDPGSVTSNTIDITTQSLNSLIVDILATDGGSSYTADETDQTARYSDESGNFAHGSTRAVVSAQGYNMTWSWTTSSAARHTVVEIREPTSFVPITTII